MAQAERDTTHFYGDGCPEHNQCEDFDTQPGVVYHAHDLPRCRDDGVRRADGRWCCERHASQREAEISGGVPASSTPVVTRGGESEHTSPDHHGIRWVTSWHAQRVEPLRLDLSRYGFDRDGRPGFAHIIIYEDRVLGGHEFQPLIDEDQLDRILRRDGIARLGTGTATRGGSNGRNRWEGGWDTLGIAISAVAYCVSQGTSWPEVLGIRWFIDRHACDGVPWLAGIDFERTGS